MEHLTLPKHCSKRPPTIPYVCKKPYDNGDFLDYPAREKLHFALLPLERGQSESRYKRNPRVSRAEYESFLQTWLFFGLINEILGKYVDHRDLVRDSDRPQGVCKILSTSAIPGAVQRWFDDLKAQQKSVTKGYSYLSRCLRVAFTNLKFAHPEIDPNLKIMLASLGEMFCFAANEAYDLKDLVTENQCPNQWRSLIDQAYWTEGMRSNGLCPSQIDLVLNGTNTIHAAYFMMHMAQSQVEGHDKCNKYSCSAYQNDMEEYQSQHVHCDCDCNLLYIEPADLWNILSDDFIPLLRIKGGPVLSEVSVDVVSSKLAPNYLALSHVWADGLGNPRENALPCCQLNFLREKMDSLRPLLDIPDNLEILLWCDTLCCPAEAGEAKNIALKQMKSVYLRASYVLVLDKSLRSWDIKEHDLDEAAMRIATCSWVRRLWTLQEAALSLEDARIWFQFKETAVNIRPLFRGIYKIRSSCISRRGLTNDISQRMREFFAYYTPKSNGLGVDLQTIVEVLRFRSVSVASDEPLIIGNLFDLDMEDIIETSSYPLRMQMVWTLMPRVQNGIPRNIIYWVAPRLETAGFRWAPATFLNPLSTNFSLSVMEDAENPGTLTERGVCVSYPGYRVDPPIRSRILRSLARDSMQSKEIDHLHMRREDGKWFNVHSRLPKCNQDFLPCEDFDMALMQPNLQLIHIPFEAEPSEFPERGTTDTVLGLLVNQIDDRSNVRYVNSLSHVMFSQVDDSTQIVLQAAYSLADTILKSNVVHKLTQFNEGNVEIDAAAKKAARESIGKEAERLACNADSSVFAAASHLTERGQKWIEELILTTAIGAYGYLGHQTGEIQQWCVD